MSEALRGRELKAPREAIVHASCGFDTNALHHLCMHRSNYVTSAVIAACRSLAHVNKPKRDAVQPATCFTLTELTTAFRSLLAYHNEAQLQH